MMRVTHLQRVSGIAGSETYLLRLLPALVRRGVDARFITLEPRGAERLNEPFYARLKSSGVPNERVPVGDLPAPTSLWALRTALRRHPPDLLHSHLIHADLFTACLKRTLLPGLRLVSTKHGYREVFQAAHGLDGSKIGIDPYSIVVRFTSRALAGAFAVSDGLRRLYVDGGLIAPEKISVIPHGMEPSEPDERDPALRVGEPQVLIVGRLVAFKGHRYALEAVARVVPRFPGLKLVLLGVGPLREELEAVAARLGIGKNVVFAGFSDRARAHMRAADVMLVPSTSEGFGLVFLEAFDAGTPVIAFDVPAANEIIEQRRSGVLVPFADVAALAEALEHLLENSIERRRLADGGAARLRAEFSLDRMVDRTIDFYERILEGRPLDPPTAPGEPRA